MPKVMLFHDPKFWLAISFTIFVIFIAKYVVPVILKIIDDKIAKIAGNLKEAEELKQKAEKFLSDAKKYHEDSIKMADQLIQDSHKESEKIILDCKKAVEVEIGKKLAAAEDRINSHEERIIREIKAKIVKSAVVAIEENIHKIADNKSLDEVAKNSISQISSKLIN